MWCNIVAPTAEYSRESLPEELSEAIPEEFTASLEGATTFSWGRWLPMVGTGEKRAQTPYAACETSRTLAPPGERYVTVGRGDVDICRFTWLC